MSVPQITITATLQDVEGNPVQGSLVFTLSNYLPDVPRVAGTSILDTIQIIANANASGVCSALLYGNDAVTPGQTFYQVDIYSGQNSTGNKLETTSYRFTGSGTQDLSNLTPLSGSPPVVIAPPPNAVLTNPAAQQQISGFPLLGAFGGLTVVPASATPVFNAQNGGAFEFTPTANVTGSTLTNVTAGQIIVFHIIQTGSFTFAWPINVINPQTIPPVAGRYSQLFQVGSNGNAYPLGPQTQN